MLGMQVLVPSSMDLQYYYVILATAIAGLIALLVHSSRKKTGAAIPGRLGLPFIGETLSFFAATYSTKGAYDFVNVRRQRYGSWFKTRILGNVHVYVPTVEGAKMIYSNDFGLFKKHCIKPIEDMIGRKSLFIVPKTDHVKIRSLLAEPFSMVNVSKFVPRIDEMVSQRLKKLHSDGKSFRVLDFTMKLGFDAICCTLMGITDAEILDDMERDVTALYDGLVTLPVMIPGTPYYKGIKARERLLKKLKVMLDDRRGGKIPCTDDFVHSMLQRDSYPDEDKLTDEEIMDNILTAMISGQSTTATAMMWSVKFLTDNQSVLDKLREEQLEIQNKIAKGASLSYEDMRKMVYASKVIKETLRMSNIVLWYPRVASADCTVDGVEIKRGWYVNVDATYIHYDPATHKDPLRFDPSRFDDIPKPYTYMPYGAGPRTCLGMNMARVAMLVFLHRLTTEYKWTLDDQDPSLECKGLVPKLRSGCPITLVTFNDHHGHGN